MSQTLPFNRPREIGGHRLTIYPSTGDTSRYESRILRLREHFRGKLLVVVPLEAKTHPSSSFMTGLGGNSEIVIVSLNDAITPEAFTQQVNARLNDIDELLKDHEAAVPPPIDHAAAKSLDNHYRTLQSPPTPRERQEFLGDFYTKLGDGPF